MLEQLKQEANMTVTENGATTYRSSLSHCVDLFATIGAIRWANNAEIITRFLKAYAEDAEIAMKLLFYGRDVRGGLGERRVFRVILKWLADNEPKVIRKNIALIPEYGRYDDLITLIGTACEAEAISVIRAQLNADLATENEVSLLAKWLPSVNASNAETVRKAKRIARLLEMSDAQYRKTLVALRKKIHIIENNLRERDYSFDYAKQPSKAMMKYRRAFLRNDRERYSNFLGKVERGEATIHTDTLMPYDIVTACQGRRWVLDESETTDMDENMRKSLDVTWNALEDFTQGENAIVVADGSGSMYSWETPCPAAVAQSLAIYFAERNKGPFHNHFITFSENPRLVEIRGKDIVDKVRYCETFNEVANTNIQKVFELILNAAIKCNAAQEELPKRIYIVSDMEFDYCADDAKVTNFERAKAMFEQNGYHLPEVIFWNVVSRRNQQPVTKNEQGVALVSGCTPRLFSMVTAGEITPLKAMMEIVESERYAPILA